MFGSLISTLYAEKGPVVIIVDEYDAPMITLLDNPKLAEMVRKYFNAFYATLKNKSEMIRFVFITGILKLSHLSIFSAANNLTDLTMNEDFAGAFGYTDEELDGYFGEGIDEYLEANPGKYESRKNFREMIRNYYDGYRFSPDSETRVYNPVSIGSFFKNKCAFKNFWEGTAISAFAVNLARHNNLMDIIEDKDTYLSEAAFTSFDISQIAEKTISTSFVTALLYYSGYLTIQGTSEFDPSTYLLGFPNMEVRASFTENLIKRYTGNEDFRETWLLEFSKACYEGNAEKVEECLKNYYSSFP